MVLNNQCVRSKIRFGCVNAKCLPQIYNIIFIGYTHISIKREYPIIYIMTS